MLKADNKNVMRKQLCWALTCVAALFTVSAAAALDSRYTDADGDLVADTPAKTVTPATLLFAYTPGEDPATYRTMWNGFLRHLETAVAKPVRFFAAQSNSAQIEA